MEKQLKTRSNEISSNRVASFIEKFLPHSLSEQIKKTRNGVRYIKGNFSDLRNNIRDMNTSDERKILFNVLIDTHIIEKGLSHESIRYNFGKEPLKRLAKNLNILIVNKMTDTEEFKYAISTLSGYYELHLDSHIDIANFIQTMDKNLMFYIKNNPDNYGGSFIIDRNLKKNNKKKSYKELVENRFTIRNFENSEVLNSQITQIIKMATKSPSACNRQSTRVVVVRSESIIKQVLEVQGGFRGYVLPSVLLATVVDMRAYSNYTDRNMAYVDGGLFTMSIVYGIEYEGLGACLLNTSFTNKKERTIRKLLQMNKSERFIAIIAIGNLKEKNYVAKSHRMDPTEITRIIE